MEIQIIEEPIRFHLFGFSGFVENKNYPQVGMALMNQMWSVVKGSKIETLGINHWVYLPDDRMFVGVELKHPDRASVETLTPLEFELKRYLRHVHVGPYDALFEKWQKLKGEITSRGERIGSPSLEIYGHHCDDPAKTETTILIALEPKDS